MVVRRRQKPSSNLSLVAPWTSLFEWVKVREFQGVVRIDSPRPILAQGQAGVPHPQACRVKLGLGDWRLAAVCA